MKKIGLFFVSIMTMSLLANCGGGGSPEPQPEPTITTYTVILNASDGASFANNQLSLCLYNVKENTPLNQIEGYALPISPEGLNFNHWTDEEGNVILENTPITSDLFLTSDFNYGPEILREQIKTYIYDDLWDILNVFDYNSPFATDFNKKQILKSFGEITTSATTDLSVTTIGGLNRMKEFYDVLKDRLFKVRNYNIYSLQDTLDECKNHLNETLQAIDDTKRSELEEAIINLSIAYFEAKSDNLLLNDNILDYAYQTLLDKIRSFSSSDINHIVAWQEMARGLMIAAYYFNNRFSLDALIEKANSQIEDILKNTSYTTRDISILAKLYANYNIAVIRDPNLKEQHNTHLSYIIENYTSDDVFKKCIVSLYESFFSAYASDKYSEGTSSGIAEVETIFYNRIYNAYTSSGCEEAETSYCSIAKLFAEGVRRNPNEVSCIKDIVDSFFDEIVSDDPTWQEYRCYIKPFASFAKATSLIDFNHETFDDSPISFNQYKANADWVIEKIDACSYKYNPDKYEAMNILSEYVAKYSDYGNYATYNDGTIYKIILKPSDYDDVNPLVPTTYLSFESAVVVDSLKINAKTYYNPTYYKNTIKELNEMVLNNWSTYSSSKFGGIFEKLFLKACCNSAASPEELVKCLCNILNDAVSSFGKDDENFFEHHLTAFLLPLMHLCNNKNIFRGREEYVDYDFNRAFETINFVCSQMSKITSIPTLKLSFAKYNTCIANVLISDYIPNITEKITINQRHNLEEQVNARINDLLGRQ